MCSGKKRHEAMAHGLEARRAVVLRPDDNVAVASRHIPQGFLIETPDGRSIKVIEPVALGHKVSLEPIAEGESIRKYGQIIGFASRPVVAGEWVHNHNVKADRFERDYAYASEQPVVPPLPSLPNIDTVTFARGVSWVLSTTVRPINDVVTALITKLTV